MFTRKNLTLIAGGMLIGVAVTLAAVQAVNTNQTHRVPMFENDHVKVWKTVIVPNSPLSMHRHEHGRTLVALKGGVATIKQDTGESQRVTWETGKAYWLDADPPGKKLHADVNEGKDNIEVMVIELKKDK